MFSCPNCRSKLYVELRGDDVKVLGILRYIGGEGFEVNSIYIESFNLSIKSLSKFICPNCKKEQTLSTILVNCRECGKKIPASKANFANLGGGFIICDGECKDYFEKNGIKVENFLDLIKEAEQNV